MASWKRPESVPYPSIWRTFEGKKEINGVRPKYWVQDLTPDYKDEFLHIMKTEFLESELICKHSNITDCEQSVQEFGELWTNLLEEKLTLICLTKNSKGQIQLVGGNMLGREYKGQQWDISPSKTKLYKKIMSLLDYLTHLKDLYTELGVDEYLSAMGLYVLPEFRGQGIAVEILKARRELCLSVGLKGSGTTFTSVASQKAAASAGFKDLVKIAYEDLEKENSDFAFPGITLAIDDLGEHIERVYLQTQMWLGNKNIRPTDWGWINNEGFLLPIKMLDMPAPEELLKMIFCNCKKGCLGACSCQQVRLFCNATYGTYSGDNCQNCPSITDQEEEVDSDDP